MRIHVSQNKTAMEEMAQVVIDNRLYVPGWSLVQWMTSIVEDGAEDYEQIAIAYLEDDTTVPVAVAYKHLQLSFSFIDAPMSARRPSIAVYVQHKYRRQGIGTQLINSLTKKDFDWHIGENASLAFFETAKQRLGIRN